MERRGWRSVPPELLVPILLGGGVQVAAFLMDLGGTSIHWMLAAESTALMSARGSRSFILI